MENKKYSIQIDIEEEMSEVYLITITIEDKETDSYFQQKHYLQDGEDIGEMIADFIELYTDL